MKTFMQVLLKIVAMGWAAPTTMVGALLLLPFGGGARVRWVRGALEVWGPGIERMFKWFCPIDAQAMVVGHLVLGVSANALAAARVHERVHVRQAELWGPLFLPLYLGASLWLFLRGKDWYRSNPFEVQAYSLGKMGSDSGGPNHADQAGHPFWPWRLAVFALAACVVLMMIWPGFTVRIGQESTVFARYSRHMNRGVMALEQFDYAMAASEYRLALEARAGDVPARVNLGIALLNLATDSGLDEATRVLSKVLEEQPGQPWATYSLGMILQYRNNLEGARALFRKITEADPLDPHGWYQYGKCLVDLDQDPGESFGALGKALALEPALNAARYALAMHPMTPPDRRGALLEEQQALIKANWEREYSLRYIEMGKYAEAMPWFGPDARKAKPEALVQSGPFSRVAIGKESRSLTGFLHGEIEHLLADGPKWLAIRVSDGADATGELGLSGGGGRILSVVDMNNDGVSDVVFVKDGALGILEGTKEGPFKPVPGLGAMGPVAMARAVDIDQDGDLDLVFGIDPGIGAPSTLALWVNAGESPPGVGGNPPAGMTWKFVPLPHPAWRSTQGISAVIPADMDGDNDLDIVLLPAGKNKQVEWIRNDRLLRFERVKGPELPGTGELVDGIPFFIEPGKPSAILVREAEVSHMVRLDLSGKKWTLNSFAWKVGGPMVRRDLDDDGQPDILALGHDHSLQVLAGSHTGVPGRQVPVAGKETGPSWRMVAPSASGDFFWGVGQDGLVASIRIESPGNRRMTVRPTGKRESNANLRTNTDGVGCLVGILAGTSRGWDQVGNGSSGVQTAFPIVLGAGRNDTADAVRLRWPDAVPQAEADLVTGPVQLIPEKNRKGTSCPVIFVRGPQGKVFVTDCLGGGALGEQGPDGAVRPARPVETVLLPELQAVNGRFVVELSEPMDEVLYLDHAKLLVVDHPRGSCAVPDERFVMGGTGPTGEVVILDGLEAPRGARFGMNPDCSTVLARCDGNYVSGFKPRGWLGYADEHALEMEFPPMPKGSRLALVMAGGVDYPYPESILAASQAGVELKAPVLERKTPRGWEVISEVGFPAGLPKTMLAPLPGGIEPGELWRLRGNMQVHWDQIRLGRVVGHPESKPLPGVALVARPPISASLEVVGFYRETVSGPMTAYDPETREPVSAQRWVGPMTRPGNAISLVNGLDDQVAICGPGRSVVLEFDANLPKPGEGMTRTFLLRVHGWCKDASTTTRTGGRVEPLPRR